MDTDGSIVIGIELEESGFQQALSRLRETARETAEQSISYLIQGLRGVSEALAQNSGVADRWGTRMLGLFRQVTVGAANTIPALENLGAASGKSYLHGVMSAPFAQTGRQMAQYLYRGFSAGEFQKAGAQAASRLILGLQPGLLAQTGRQMAQYLYQGFSTGSFFAMGYQAAALLLQGLRSGDYAGSGLASARTALMGFASGGFYSTGAMAGAQLAAGFHAGGSGISSSAQSMAYYVRSAFSAGGWYSVGYNISAGVAYGISSGSGLIYSAAVSAAQYALYAAKRALGVRSPSRVFREEVGQMIPAGIALGVADKQDVAGDAVRRQSLQLVNTARQTVIPAAASAAAGTGQMHFSGGVQVRLEAPLYVDGRELARATAKYTGQQLAWEAM